jgi:integrase
MTGTDLILSPAPGLVPAQLLAPTPKTTRRVLEFLTAQVNNDHTRKAYLNATKIGNHTFRATGITAYLKSDGTLEHAQQIANHASPRTTKLYDRRADEISLDEVEKISI